MDDVLNNNHEDFNELGDQSVPSEDNVLKNVEKPVGGFAPAPQTEKLPASERLLEVMHRDEQYFGKLAPERIVQAKSSPEEMKKFLDEQRLANRVHRLEVQAMLDKGELKTDSDFDTAAVIFQHGFSPEDSKTAFKLSLKAIGAGQPAEAALTPAAFDRFMIHTQLNQGIPIERVKQRFGKQTYPDAQGNMFKPALDGQATPDELQLFGIHLPDSDQPVDNANLDQGKLLASLTDKLNTYKLAV